MSFLSNIGSWVSGAYHTFTNPLGDVEDFNFGPSGVPVPTDTEKKVAEDNASVQEEIVDDYNENNDPLGTALDEGGFTHEDLDYLANGAQTQSPFEKLKAQATNAVLGAEVAYVSTVEDERGVGAGVLNYLGDFKVDVPFFGEVPVAEMIVNSSPFVRETAAKTLIGNTDFEKMTLENKAELNELVGNPRLGLLLDAVAPRAAAALSVQLGKKNPGFKPWLDNEGPRLEKIIRGILFKVVVNFAKDTKLKMTEFDPTKTDLSIEMLKTLLKISNRQMLEIAEQGEFDQIEKHQIPEIQKAAFRKLFAPAAEEFLAIALPNGKADLELRSVLAGAIYDTISEKMLPDMFVDIYRLEHKQPFHTQKDLEILEKRGGAALKHIAAVVGKEIAEVIPKLLAKKAHKLAEKGLKESGLDNLAWLKTWMGDRITEFATSEDPEIKAIWDFAEKNIESIMIHALASIAGSEEVGPDGNVIPVVAGKGLKVLDEFVTENQEAIDAVDAKVISEHYTKKQRDNEREDLFKPLVDTIIKMAHLENNKRVELVDSEKIVRKILPIVLSKIHQDMKAYQLSQPAEEARLGNKLIDPVAYQHKAMADPATALREMLEGRENGQAVVLEQAGINQTVQELSAACGILAEDVTKIAKAFAKKDEIKIAHLINKGLFKNNRLNTQEEKDFAEGLHQIMNGENPSMEKIWEYAETIIKATIFKVFVRVAENTQVEPGDDPAVNINMAIPGNVMHRVLSFLADRMPDVDARIEEIRNSDMSKADQKMEITQLFVPLAKDFLDLAGDNLKDILPVPKMFRKFLAKKLQEDYLPTIFKKIYKDLNGWRYEAPTQEAQLDTLFPDGSGKNAATTIANYIKDFVPYYLETNPDKVTNLLQNKVMSKYFNALSPEHQVELSNLIEKNVHALGVNPDMKKTAEAIGEYSRGIILKMFAGVTQNIDSKEKTLDHEGNNKFLFNTTLGFIRVLGDHVRRINKIPPKGRMYPAHQVPHDAMLDGFVNHPILPNMLHPALAKDLDPNATEEDRKNQRLKEFFVPFAADLLSISGINNPADFPAPSFMKDEAWDMFKTQILPEVLMNVYEEMLKPDNLNMVMLKSVDALIEEIDKLPEECEDDKTVEIDSAQRELNEALGDVVKEMIDLMPDIWTKTILSSDRIRNMTSETLGRIIRRKLDSTTMIEMMNKGLAGLKLNKPDADRGKTTDEIKAEKTKIEEELNKKMTSYISRQVKDALKTMIKTKWDTFQAKFDRGVQKAFGKPGLAVKRFLDKIFHFIFFTLLGPVFNFILYKCIWYFIEKKIATKSKEIIKDVQMPINENVMLNFTQTWLNAMKGVEGAQNQDQQFIQENLQLRRARAIEAEQLALHDVAVETVVENNLDEEEVVDSAVEATQKETENLNALIAEGIQAVNLQTKI